MKRAKQKQHGRSRPALRIHAGVSRPRASTGGSLPPPGPPLAIFPVRGEKGRHEGPTRSMRVRSAVCVTTQLLLQEIVL
jgi:hypothetical protein